jgi:hypothetical protein
MVDSVTRDLLVHTPQIPFGHGRTLRFVKHDEGQNFRATTYTSLGWLMMLNLPMDYRNEEFPRESLGKFGKMRGWFREDPLLLELWLDVLMVVLGIFPGQ